MNDVQIRRAKVADLDAMVRLLHSLTEVEPDFRPEPARQKRGLAMLLGDPRATVVVADLRGAVVGMATAQLLTSTAEGEPSALVEDVVVEERLRGAGVGRQIVEELEAWARGHNATRLQLLTDRDNEKALGFYERLGWRRTRMIALRRGGTS